MDHNHIRRIVQASTLINEGERATADALVAEVVGQIGFPGVSLIVQYFIALGSRTEYLEWLASDDPQAFAERLAIASALSSSRESLAQALAEGIRRKTGVHNVAVLVDGHSVPGVALPDEPTPETGKPVTA